MNISWVLVKWTVKCGGYSLQTVIKTSPYIQGVPPKPVDFSGVRKILSMPSFGGEVK